MEPDRNADGRVSSRIVPAASNLVQVDADYWVTSAAQKEPKQWNLSPQGTAQDTRADPGSTRGGGARMARYSATTYHNQSTRVAVAGWGW